MFAHYQIIKKALLYDIAYIILDFGTKLTVLVVFSLSNIPRTLQNCGYYCYNPPFFLFHFSFLLQRKIASCSVPTSNWTALPEQKSAVISLQKGRSYFLQAVHVQYGGKRHLKIGVKLQKTRYVNSQIGSAINEKQQIRLTSVRHPEVQVSKLLVNV